MENEATKAIKELVKEFIRNNVVAGSQINLSGNLYMVKKLTLIDVFEVGCDEENIMNGKSYPINATGQISFEYSINDNKSNSTMCLFRLLSHHIKYKNGKFTEVSPENSVINFSK